MKFTYTVERDDAMRAPWVEHDGHGDVRESMHGDKRPGEVLLHHNGRRHYWFYDWQAAMKTAKKEGWGIALDDIDPLFNRLGRPATAGEIRAEAVRKDFEHLRGWLRDEWSWAYYVIHDEEGNVVDALGGIEGFDEAEKMAKECIAELEKERT